MMLRPLRAPTSAPRAAADVRRSAARVGQDRAHQLRRARRADRPHAPHAGRREEMDRRAALSLGPQLLHAAAGAGGHAARHLRRLAPARAEGRPGGRAAVRAAGRAGGAHAVDAVRGVRQAAGRRGAVRRRQGGGAGDRRRGAAARRQAGAQGQRRLADRGGGLRRHLLPEGAVPGDRHRGGAGRLLARRCAAGDLGQRAQPSPCRQPRRCARHWPGSPSGSRRCSSWPPCSGTTTCWRRSAGSSPSSPW